MIAQANRSITKKSSQCIHCGTMFAPNTHRPDYCCAGCQFVHDLIVKNGLGQFYDLQDGGVFPVRSVVFQKSDYAWLEKLVEAVSDNTLSLELQGISCVGCVWLIEKVFQQKPGARTIRIDSTLGRIEMTWTPGEFDMVDFARDLQSFGYLVGPIATGGPKRSPRGLLLRLGLCSALAMNAMLFTLPGYLGMEAGSELAVWFNRIAFACGTLSFFIGGSYFFGRSWHSTRHGVLHIDLPISLGLIAAYTGSLLAWRAGATNFVYFDFVSIFTFLMLAGRWVQQAAVDANRNRLLNLPTTVQQPAVGDTYSVASGQVIPVRSRLLSPAATLGLEWINGEADAAYARLGQIVPAGAIHLGADAIALEAVENWADSLLEKLLHIAPRGDTRAPGVERFIRVYLVAVLIVGAAAFGGWYYATGNGLLALQVLTSILVVSCPCASGVALPLADELAVARVRKFGLFVRESTLWSRLGRVRKIIFDKTGTLTLETMSLLNPASLHALTSLQQSALLALVHDNLHPVSCCLRETLLANGVVGERRRDIHESPGFGLAFRDPSGHWQLGRPGWAAESPTPADTVFSLAGQLLAAFRFGEETRADAVEEIALLQKRGFTIHILSGDRTAKVGAMARRLSIPLENAHSQMTPQEKADWLLQIDARDTLMIGDGANDSLAFNEAYCTGTPAIDRGLLEHKADFYFLGRNLEGIRRLLDAARARRRAVHTVLAFALTYNASVVAIAISGQMNPLAAAILMPISSLVTLAIVGFGLRTGK